MVEFEELVKGIEESYAKAKNKECEDFYNTVIDLITERSVSVQNVLFVLKMIEWGYLRAKYLELVEEAVKIPKDSVPLKKIEKEKLVEP